MKRVININLGLITADSMDGLVNLEFLASVESQLQLFNVVTHVITKNWREYFDESNPIHQIRQSFLPLKFLLYGMLTTICTQPVMGMDIYYNFTGTCMVLSVVHSHTSVTGY